MGLTGESCELVGWLWSAQVLIHAELLPFHKWLRAAAERSRATMINAVIKPASRLLKCYTRSPGEGERQRGAHRKQISHQTLMYYRFTRAHTHIHQKKKKTPPFPCNVTQICKSLMPLKFSCGNLSVRTSVSRSQFNWPVRSDGAIRMDFYSLLTQNGCNIFAQGRL